MGRSKGEYYVLPNGWSKCVGIYRDTTAAKMLEIWNARNDGYFYKAFPRYKKNSKSFIIGRIPKEELK